MKNLISLCAMVAFVAVLTLSSIGCGGSTTQKSTTVTTGTKGATTEVTGDPKALPE
jgi:archaellin